MNVLAIDPGNTHSGWCIIDSETLRPLNFDKSENEDVLILMENQEGMTPPDLVVVERMVSYGMAVSHTVFEACEWIGRFIQKAEDIGIPFDFVFRIDEKMHICHDSRARDSNIRRALINRFADHDMTNGRGSKKNPDFFYGFHTDIWSAYAIGLTYIEKDRPG